MEHRSLLVLMIVVLALTLVACGAESEEPATLVGERQLELVNKLDALEAKLDTLSEMVAGLDGDLVVEESEPEPTAEVAVEVAEPEPTAEGEAAELIPVRYLQFKVYDPVYIGIDKGFCEQRGLDVQLVGDVIAGPNAIQAVAGGSAEAGLSSIPAIINANAAGLPIQGVVDIQTTFEDQPLQRWFSLRDSGIESIWAIEDKTYAVNIWRSSFHYTTLRMLDAMNIPEENVDFVLLSFADQIPALLEGEIDVAGLIPPYQGYLLNEYGDLVQEVWNDYDLYGDNHVSLIFVNRIWARENPAIAREFVGCIVDSINWVEENQEAARDIVGAHTGIPADAIGDYHFTENGQVISEDVQDWLDYLLERGDVTADWLQVEDIATNKFNAIVVNND
jgi:NitT/TauT family transport system substrate-binding protein